MQSRWQMIPWHIGPETAKLHDRYANGNTSKQWNFQRIYSALHRGRFLVMCLLPM